MNKNSVIKYVGPTFIGTHPPALTKGKKYKVVAGKGDGVPRNDGRVGAFIQADDVVVITDDKRCYKVVKLNSNWEIVKEAESEYQAKPVFKDPIPLSRAAC